MPSKPETGVERWAIEFAGDTPRYLSEHGPWVKYRDHVAALDAIRKQERQRVREALESTGFGDLLADAIEAAYADGFNTRPPDYEPVSADRLFENPTHMRKVVAIQKAARKAALDSLRDSDAS